MLKSARDPIPIRRIAGPWLSGPVAATRRKLQPTAAAGCSNRLFLGTNDARLIALDGQSGAVCSGFGDGKVNLVTGIGKLLWAQEYQGDVTAGCCGRCGRGGFCCVGQHAD